MHVVTKKHTADRLVLSNSYYVFFSKHPKYIYVCVCMCMYVCFYIDPLFPHHYQCGSKLLMIDKKANESFELSLMGHVIP